VQAGRPQLQKEWLGPAAEHGLGTRELRALEQGARREPTLVDRERSRTGYSHATG